MKKLIAILLLLPALAHGAANDLFINQRNDTDTGTLNRTLSKPPGTQDGIVGYKGVTSPDVGPRPLIWTIGAGLAIQSDSLVALPQAWAEITGKPVFAPVATAGTYASLTGIPSTFAPAAHTQAFSTITATPTTLSGYGITDAYPLAGNPSGFLTGITSGQVTSALGFTPYNSTNPSAYISQAGARSAISLTTTGTSGVATYNSTTGVLNVPNYAPGTGTVTSITAGTGLSGGTITTSGTISLPNTGTAGTYQSVTTDAQGRVISGNALSINDAPGRTLVTTTTSTGYQISTTRTAEVCYEGSFSTTSTIGGPSGATVFLETADTNSTTAGDWTIKAQQAYSNNITLAIVLNQVQANNWAFCRYIPAGKFVRIRSGNITGTASVSLNTQQQEVLH